MLPRGFESRFHKGFSKVNFGFVAKVDAKRGFAKFDLAVMFADVFGFSVGVCNSGFGASGFAKVDTSREFAVDTKGLIKLMCQMGMRKLLCQRV